MIAELLVGVVAAYAALGVLFACVFVVAGVDRIDPAARRAPLGFRLLIFPGSVALWPLLAARWYSGASHPPTERNAHRDAAERARRAR